MRQLLGVSPQIVKARQGLEVYGSSDSWFAADADLLLGWFTV
jgi:hypothetical protein